MPVHTSSRASTPPATARSTYRRESSSSTSSSPTWIRMGGNPEKRPRSGDLLLRKVRIGVRACLVGRAREGQISDGRECRHCNKSGLGGHRFGGDARGQYERQIPSGRVSGDGNPAYPAVVHPAVHRQHIINGCRKRMLGSKSIVGNKRFCTRPRGDVPDKVAIGRGASRDEPPAVHVQNGLVRST